MNPRIRPEGSVRPNIPVPNGSGPPPRALITITPDVARRLREPRVVAGWLLCLAAAVVVVAGWIGISGTLDPGQQLPYLISGGVGGLFLLGLGVALLLSSDLAETRRQVGELRQAIDALTRDSSTTPAE